MGWGSSPEAEAYLLMNALILMFCQNTVSELLKNRYHKITVSSMGHRIMAIPLNRPLGKFVRHPTFLRKLALIVKAAVGQGHS